MKIIHWASVISLVAISANAAPLTSGDILIYRVGDGSAALGTAATAVYLDEYTQSGALVQSIALPTTGTGRLTAVGNASTEGILSRSQDGQRLIFTGYQAAAATANAATLAANKVIGTIGLNGIVDTTSFAVTDVGTTTTIRSATSVDGLNSFYISSSTGVRYVGAPGTAATSTLIDSRNSRQVNLNGNVLFASNGSTTTTSKIQDYGVLPTGATTATADISLPSAQAVNGFVLLDLNPSIAGADTMYFLNTVLGALMKATFNGSSWATNTGTISTSAQNIDGYADASGAHLFLTTASTLYSELDSSGYGANMTGSLTVLATAGANTALRGGIVIPQIPEPSALCLSVLGGVGVLILRRRRS
jgi:hypothetical protein